MSLPSKSTTLQAYHMQLYRNALHPEFFGIEGRRQIAYGAYDFEAWIYKGGHVARFEHAGVCTTEVVTESTDLLPDRGLVASLPCAGEKDHEAEVGEKVDFVTSMQTETLTDHLYMSTYREMIEHGESNDALMTAWADQSGQHNLSVIDIQRYLDEVHVQGYHLRCDCGLVLRTQSIFQIKQPDETDS